MKNAVDNGINLRKVGARPHRHHGRRAHAARHTRSRVARVRRLQARLSRRLSRVSPARRRLSGQSAYLTHPVFHMNRAESEMTRYMRRLADRDLALDRAMIPLGSCTMKLNATAEMLPITWPEFAEIHPFAPADQALGYAEMIEIYRASCARSPATTPSRCSPTPARRANMRDCRRGGVRDRRQYRDQRRPAHAIAGAQHLPLARSARYPLSPAFPHRVGAGVAMFDPQPFEIQSLPADRAAAQNHK